MLLPLGVEIETLVAMDLLKGISAGSPGEQGQSRQIKRKNARCTCNDDALPIELGKTFEKSAGDFVKATYEVCLARDDESMNDWYGWLFLKKTYQLVFLYLRKKYRSRLQTKTKADP